MSSSTVDNHTIYEDLKGRASHAVFSGELHKARKLYEWAFTEARRLDEPLLMERIYCNLASISGLMGQVLDSIPRLRDIGEKSPDPMNRLCATNTLASLYRDWGELQEASVWCAAARQNAQIVDCPHWIAGCLHNEGILALQQSDLNGAQPILEDSVESCENESQPGLSALYESALGYCLALMGQERRAEMILGRSLENLSSRGPTLYDGSVKLSVGYALLEIEDFAGSLDLAVDLLKANFMPTLRKHILYLAAESYASLGYFPEAREIFHQFQTEFYPHDPSLTDTLLSLRTHRLINWLS